MQGKNQQLLLKNKPQVERGWEIRMEREVGESAQNRLPSQQEPSQQHPEIYKELTQELKERCETIRITLEKITAYRARTDSRGKEGGWKSECLSPKSRGEAVEENLYSATGSEEGRGQDAVLERERWARESDEMSLKPQISPRQSQETAADLR